MWLSQFDQYHTLFNANLAQFINLRFFKLCQNYAQKKKKVLQKIIDDHTSILNKTRYNVMLYTRQILHWVIVLMSNKCKFCLCIIHYGKCMTIHITPFFQSQSELIFRVKEKNQNYFWSQN